MESGWASVMAGHMCVPLPLQEIDQIIREKQEPTMNISATC